MDDLNKECLICESDKYEDVLVFNSPDKYESSMGITEENYLRKWVKCLNCDFHYSIFSRDSESFDKIYEEQYRDSGSSWRGSSVEDVFNKVINLPEHESETKQRVNWIKNTINQATNQGILPYRQRTGRFLDIGGGSGIFAYEFQDENWTSHIIDPSLDENFIRDKLQILYVKSYYSPREFEESFDLVSLIYVLEHIKDPKEVIGSIHRDMEENSLLYIEVPDAMAFSKKPKEDDIFNSTHLWMFDPKSLVTLLDKEGFEPLALSRVKTKRDNYALMSLFTIK